MSGGEIFQKKKKKEERLLMHGESLFSNWERSVGHRKFLQEVFNNALGRHAGIVQ